MAHHLFILPRAQKVLEKLPGDIYERIRDDIRSLSLDPRPLGCKKLVGRNGWRLRVNQHRIIYEIDDKKRTVIILDIGNRKEVYRK